MLLIDKGSCIINKVLVPFILLIYGLWTMPDRPGPIDAQCPEYITDVSYAGDLIRCLFRKIRRHFIGIKVQMTITL
jgi:hypothetical protein